MSNSLADLNRFGTVQQNRAPATTPAQFVCEKTFSITSTSTVALSTSTSRTDMLHPLDVLNNQEDFGKNMGACNMERPAFRRRIAFIEAGRIDRTRLV